MFLLHGAYKFNSHDEFWPPEVLQFQQSVQDYYEQSKNGWCETLSEKTSHSDSFQIY